MDAHEHFAAAWFGTWHGGDADDLGSAVTIDDGCAQGVAF